MRRTIAIAFCIAGASPALAGGDAYPPTPYYREAPPVAVFSEPPPPPAIIIVGVVAGALSLPFGILGAIFGPPQAPLVQANSRYDPYTGQFLPPGYAPPPVPLGPPSYTPETPRRPPAGLPRSSEWHPGGCYGPSGEWRGDGNQECAN